MVDGKKRIVILGGGFGGVYTAIHLTKKLSRFSDWEVVLINREDYFVYQPMLSEVIGGALEIFDTVSSLHRLIPKCHLITREAEGVDLEKKELIITPRFSHSPARIAYDHLVFALGNVVDFRNAAGLHEHALPFKNLADTFRIRNQVIDAVETANVTKDPLLKKQLLTFVVGGGGFSGTEIIAELADFVRKVAKNCENVDPKEIRLILVHKKNRLMNREISQPLSTYVEKLLKKKGVEILFEKELVAATPQSAVLDDGTKIESQTIISTVPATMNPILEALPFAKEENRVKVTEELLVEGSDHIWALGDCARIPLPEGGFAPPTAQFATREAKTLAENLISTIEGKKRRPFCFKSLGMLGALGHHSAFAELFGAIRISGFFAWILWRVVYWIKLPGLSRKVKVGLSWFLSAIFPLDIVQLKMAPSQGIARLHFETGEVIFHEGDIGDYLYMIIEGKVEVIKEEKGKVAELGKGEFFGEIALLNQRTRTATIRCLQPTDVLALRKSDFGLLIANFRQLRETFEKIGKERS